MKNINFDNLPQVAPELDLRDLLEAGCHFGHHTKSWHPKMAEWIYMEKDGIHIFDLAKTAQQLQKAYNLIHQYAQQKKTVVFVGTKRQAREIIREKAQAAGAMYIVSRWLGGTLTNWDQIKKSLNRMKEIESGLKTGKFDGYTKLERVKLDKEAARLRRFFEGLRDLKTQPDLIVVVDPTREENMIKEANLMGVPVIGVIDSNGDPSDLSLAVPANDDARSSIEFIVEQLTQAYAQGSGNKAAAKTKAAAEEGQVDSKEETSQEKSK